MRTNISLQLAKKHVSDQRDDKQQVFSLNHGQVIQLVYQQKFTSKAIFLLLLPSCMLLGQESPS